MFFAAKRIQLEAMALHKEFQLSFLLWSKFDVVFASIRDKIISDVELTIREFIPKMNLVQLIWIGSSFAWLLENGGDYCG